MRYPRLAAALLLLALAGCSKAAPPVGKWEGGYDSGGTMVAARVEIAANGAVKVSAPDLTNIDATAEQRTRMREKLGADLVGAWETVEARTFEFDGKTFRKPGGYAPQMVWDSATNQMTLELYIGANPALPVILRPVEAFHDDPWPSG
ncbi:MAG TPA: hypothetical protein VHZ32_00270 [Rhizomicrobium sp.]|nr:hypothetical protein [Rhizomicrobium sp.]